MSLAIVSDPVVGWGPVRPHLSVQSEPLRLVVVLGVAERILRLMQSTITVRREPRVGPYAQGERFSHIGW
jgi:hypothetical protein